MKRLDEVAALATDVNHLMDALPEMANIMRYGNVRQTDVRAVGHIVNGLLTRICVGVPGACASLNDDAAREMYERILRVDGAVTLLQDQEQITGWRAALAKMLNQHGLHGLIAGRCCRLLADAGTIDRGEALRHMGLALSLANDPALAGAWAEGFLRDSGVILLHDEALWQLIDQWVIGLPAESFQALLPLLRRTFSTFPEGERRQLGERVKRGASVTAVPVSEDSGFDIIRADAALPLVVQLLGLNDSAGGSTDGNSA
jgi:hypothetical protein